ncbi:luciferin 4-monooxygenase-like isoform X1 [Choristoneura fumiferana]|uniref:luciferin 4-monooxygenase-like isoform X1 n=2 Tax=Choristoneura fumiferana TaxID=7141 RepID=UPI003D1599DB
MYSSRRTNDSVHWFMNELTSRVVAASGISTDRHHLGKILLQSFKDEPDFVMQIDGATGESETSGSVLERTVRCAISFRKFGLQHGDVIVLMAPNHIDLAIPFYAAFYLGVIVSPIDRTLGGLELQGTFDVNRPKLIFCQSERAPDVQLALNSIESDALIVTFDKGDYLCSFAEFIETYGDNSPIEDFKPTDFDPEDTIALLIATSGTTGLPKGAAATHKNLTITGPYLWMRHSQFPHPTKMVLIGSPLQWLTALINFIMSPVLRYTRLQSSQSLTQDHACYLINTYQPTFTVLSPTFATTLMRANASEPCDFTCLESILLGGSAVLPDLIQEMKKLTPNTEILNVYGLSELTSIGFMDDETCLGSSGKPIGCLQYRLIDVETQDDIYEPNKNGELWLKGPGIIKCYYKNPEATEDTFAEGRWFKTGDMFYRDENYNFFFVERIKLLLKYMSHQISPVELEGVIRQHPAVSDVAVTSVSDPECGELPVACVVRKPGYDVTAEEIKDIVKDNLVDSKRLRGGVIFLDAIPQTASTKVHRRKLKEIALQAERE